MSDSLTQSNSITRALSWRAVWLGIAVVFIVHSSLVLLLYRGRIISHWPISASDAVVFGLPFLIAYSAIAHLCFRSPALRQLSSTGRVFGILALSLIIVFLSVWLSMLVPLNLYGS